MRRSLRNPILALAAAVLASATSPGAIHAAMTAKGKFYLPDADTSKSIVSVTTSGSVNAEIIVQTLAVAVKETGPKTTVSTFGEVYAFSPTFIAVRLGEPTRFTFWNLQPDDEHDFALLGRDFKVLMYMPLPPLKKTSFIFTFHQAGLFDFRCLTHQPEMAGQILVVPADTR